jgi:hypothetical protein
VKADPVIDAIRKVRHQISASVGHDPRKLVEHYRRLQERHRDRVVSRNVEEPKSKNENVA